MRPHTRFLINLFKELDFMPDTMAEIGVFKGDNAYSLLENTDIEALIGVDPYVRYPEFDKNLIRKNGVVANADLEIVYKNTLKRMKQFGYRFQLLRYFSGTAASMFDNGLFDVVFIDGNHHYNYVLEDIKLWLPKVRKNGIVAGHDYSNIHPGVIKAVTELLPNHKANRGSKVWWYQKEEV